VNACREIEVLVSLRAAGALEPEEASRVEAHLAECAACRAEAEADAQALAFAKLPPPTDAELRAMRDLTGRTLEALRRTGRRRFVRTRLLAGLAVAAAAGIALLAPAALRRTPELPEAPEPQATWEEPDVDQLWEDAGVIEDETTSALPGGDEADAVIAALEM
jgi:anti-sigma factor RsiW